MGSGRRAPQGLRAGRHWPAAAARARGRGETPTGGTAEDPRRPPPGPTRARRYFADRVGTLGGRIRTIIGVSRVDLLPTSCAGRERVLILFQHGTLFPYFPRRCPA